MSAFIPIRSLPNSIGQVPYAILFTTRDSGDSILMRHSLRDAVSAFPALRVFEVDCSEECQLQRDFGIREQPTVLLVAGNEVRGFAEGLTSTPSLRSMLQSSLNERIPLL